jgi:hypothetical protein
MIPGKGIKMKIRLFSVKGLVPRARGAEGRMAAAAFCAVVAAASSAVAVFPAHAAFAAGAPSDSSVVGLPLPSALATDNKAAPSVVPTIKPPDADMPSLEGSIGASPAVTATAPPTPTSSPASNQPDPLAWSGSKDQKSPAAPEAGGVTPPPFPAAAQQPPAVQPSQAQLPPLSPPAAQQPPPAIGAPPAAEAMTQPGPGGQQISPHAPSSDSPPAQDARVTHLEDELHAMEQRIKALEDSRTMKSELESLRQDVEALRRMPAKDAAPSGKNEKPKDHAKEPDSGKRHVPSPRKAKTADHAAGASPKTAKWVLKSAKPGMAWVAEPGSSELRSVTVGESIPGLGKILSIAPDASGKWEINGTKGKLGQ